VPVAKAQKRLFAGLLRGLGNSVYPAVWQSDNHCRNAPRHEAAGERDRAFGNFWEIETPGGSSSAGNEGVGEHVRTKSQLAKSAGEIADLWIRTDEENFFLLPSRFSKRASPVENCGPAV
jgi:hypothetical protein